MGEKDNKISTIVLKVDLECQRCYKKIRRVLCKIQDKMDIKTISFDEKSNSVSISGPFDAEKVYKKLCCKAGRVIKEMNIKGKESPKDGGDNKAAAKPDAGKPEKAKEGKADNKEGKGEKEKKEAKAETKEAKPNKENKDAKPEKKVRFVEGDEAAADAKLAKAAIPKADLGPLLEKMMAANNKVGPEPPRGEPIAPPPAAQGVAVPSIWPAPASSLAGYSYNPSYDPSSYYGGGYGYGACGCGYGGGYCRCGKQPATPGSGYYGVPVYDNQGWYYGGRQPYYPQQQQHYEDPNAGCSVM